MDSMWENLNAKDVQAIQIHIKEHGVSGMEELLAAKLEQPENFEINIGIAGDVGVGKSSFVNAIRGLPDDDKDAAPSGVTMNTLEVTKYQYCANSNIIFWDLPGVGTTNHPTVEMYCKQVDLKKYDVIFILTAKRFTEYHRLLGRKVKSIKKSIFFIRTHVDIDLLNLSKKLKISFNEEVIMNDIRKDCLKKLEGLPDGDEDVFLISNHHPAKWDFPRLKYAILDFLPLTRQEDFTTSLTYLSTEMLKEKVKMLRDRIWMVAAASVASALVPLPGLSMAIDFTMILNEVRFYMLQLGLPDENSKEFQIMSKENQEKVRKLCFSNTTQMAPHFAAYTDKTLPEEVFRLIPFIGIGIAGSNSYAPTYCFLRDCLNELEETAHAFLNETCKRAKQDFQL